MRDMLGEPGLQVYKYWEDRPQPASTHDANLPVIVYAAPGRRALVAVVSYSERDEAVTLQLDRATLGLTGALGATDAESGAALEVDGAAIRFPLRKHDIRLIALQPR